METKRPSYIEVAVEDRAVKSTLTYQAEEPVPVGSIVRLKVRNKAMNGVVLKSVRKPKFQTKPIDSVILTAAVPKHLLRLADWLSEHYASELSSIIQLLIPRGAHKKRRAGDNEKNTPSREKKDFKLTEPQNKAVASIHKSHGTTLLHGVTGSGKTAIYLELTKQAQRQKRGSIILVPEIGLTSQMVADAKASLRDVFVIHSQLTEAQRHVLWQRISQTEAPVVIGPRSALFSPIGKLGLIVVDEEHESSYKQDQSPRYHAVRVAAVLAKFTEAKLVLGSATPRVEDTYLARQSGANIVRIRQPVNELNDLHIEVVDMKDRGNFTRKSGFISDRLIEAIETALADKQQVLLFHNRRGSSTMVVCMNCGWLAECPNCLLPLTHHADWQQLVCHVCNHRSPILGSCPDCKEPELRYKGIGTKQIVSDVHALFPSAKIVRFDSDVSKDERLDERYQAVYDGDYDIIVGTQMVAKGLDLPRLRTVGVILADSALYVPDYSANERAFQLLYQVIGRVGRHQEGSVVIQTYSPEHAAIKAANERDYETFYDNEVRQRQLTGYPPFVHLLKLTCERTTEKSAMQAAERLRQQIQELEPRVQLLGPSPAFHEKTAHGYRWQLVVKAKRRTSLTNIANHLPARWQYDLDPVNLL